MKIKAYNANKTCWNCPAAVFKGNVDFRACGQTPEKLAILRDPNYVIMIECARRPELGHFEPTITFEQCPEWEYRDEISCYLLKEMRVMILGIDGYLGWTLALRMGRLGCKVSGIDNYFRRDCVAEKLGGQHLSIVPITTMEERLSVARQVLGIEITFREIDILDRQKLGAFLVEIKPEAIVHYAECPSAPYSMVDCDHAIKVQYNNVIGTLGLLFLMKEIVPETSLIKLGTLGEFGSPLTGRPLFEGIFPADAVLKYNEREWSLGGELTPRDPPSFYHVSKVQDTFNIYEACKYWWLRSYDVMQGVIYGVHTAEVAVEPRLRTRLDADEWFGTVVNRFVIQAILGLPLTVYGQGEQIRGFIALDDAMQCMVRLIASPPEPGQYDVVNQVSGLYKINRLAETVAKVGNEKFGLNVKLQRVENPRVEADFHPFEVVSKKLPRTFGFEPKVSLEEEITNMFSLLTQPHIKKRIEETAHVFWPVTRWDGDKRKSEVIEVYAPGTKKNGGFQPQLDTGKELVVKELEKE